MLADGVPDMTNCVPEAAPLTPGRIPGVATQLKLTPVAPPLKVYTIF